MIESNIIDIATRRIGIDLAEQEKRIALSLLDARRKAIAVGMLNSSRTVLAIERVHTDAIHERIGFVWAAIKRSLEAGGITYFDAYRYTHLFSLIKSITCSRISWAPQARRRTQNWCI